MHDDDDDDGVWVYYLISSFHGDKRLIVIAGYFQMAEKTLGLEGDNNIFSLAFAGELT